MNRFENESIGDVLMRECLDAIGEVDRRASFPMTLPKYVVDAAAHAAVASQLYAECPEAAASAFKGLLALTKNFYKAGYAAGVADTEAKLGANRG